MAIQNRDLSGVGSLKSAEDVKDVTGGEALLRKLTEPYRGKLVFARHLGHLVRPVQGSLVPFA